MSVTVVGRQAFSGCRSLKRVTFAKGSAPASTGDAESSHCGCQKIGAECFWGSGLEELVLPSGVKEVGAGAFKG